MSDSKNSSTPNTPPFHARKEALGQACATDLSHREDADSEVMATQLGVASANVADKEDLQNPTISGTANKVKLPKLSMGNAQLDGEKPKLSPPKLPVVSKRSSEENTPEGKPSVLPRPPMQKPSFPAKSKTMVGAGGMPKLTLGKVSTETAPVKPKDAFSNDKTTVSKGDKPVASTSPSLPNSDKTMVSSMHLENEKISSSVQNVQNLEKAMATTSPSLPNSDRTMVGLTAPVDCEKTVINAPAVAEGEKSKGKVHDRSGLGAVGISLAPSQLNAAVKREDDAIGDKTQPAAKKPPLPPRSQGEPISALSDAIDMVHGILEAAEKSSEGAVVDQELPEAWLSGTQKMVQPGAPRSMFSSPNVMPEAQKQASYAHMSDQTNVDLEQDAGLPEELLDVIEGYDDEIRQVRTRDGARECTIQLAIARILEHTGHEKLAYVRYLKALEANHFSRTAIHELRRIARAYNKTKDVLTLLQSDIDTDLSADEQALLLEECALIQYFAEKPQVEDALKMLYRAVALAPRCISPVCTLFYLLLFEQRYKECCDALDKMIALTDDRNIQVACHTLKADIESCMKTGASTAMNSYLHALELSPGAFYPYLHGMTHLMRQGAWQTVFARSNAFAEACRDKVISSCALLLAGSVSYDLLSDGAGSRAAYEQAMKYVPSDVLPLEMLLENISDDPTQWQAYDQVLYELIKATEVPKERLEMTLMRAINLDRNGKSPSAAIDVMREILREMPQNRLTLEYYLDLLQRDGRIDEFMQVSHRVVEISNAEEAAERLTSLGCYCYDVLKKYHEAEQNFKGALAINPGQRTAFEYLEQILRSRQDYAEIARIYRMRLEITQDAKTRASLLYTLATLYDYSLGQADNAIFYYRQYREIYPDDIHAIHNLQRLSQKTKDWKQLIEMLLIEKDYVATATDRCDILLRIARICRHKMNRNHYAISFLHQARQENPKNLAVYRELYEVLLLQRSWKELIEVLEAKLAITKKAADRVMTLFSMGHVHENMLCDARNAVNCYEQILAIEPDNTMAMTRLSHIYRTSGNMAAYYELALDKAQHLPLPTARARLLCKVALKTLTAFKDTEQAIAILEQALPHDPGYTPVVFLLALLYGATSRMESLATLMQDFTNATKHQATKSASAMMLSYLYTWVLNHPNDALHPLELALALSPEAMNARVILLHSQFNRQQMTELAPLFAEGAQNTKDKNIAAHDYNLAAFIAHAYPMSSGAFENEVSSLKSSLEIDPYNVIANERLEAMEPCRANLVPFLEKRLNTVSQDDKTELQVAIVESIYTDQPQKAFSMICDVVEENPSHLPALRIAANIARQLDNPTLWVRFLAQQAQCIEHLERRVLAWCEAARVARDKLNHIDMAIDYFKQAFMLAPQRMDLCDQLLDLCKKKHDMAAIDSILQIHTRSISRENQVIRYIQMADDYIKEFNEPAQAAVKLHQALEIEHDNVEALWKLAQIELSQSHWNEARSALENIISLNNITPQVMTQAKMSLASIYLDNLSLPKKALPLLQDILSRNPDDVQAIERMADIYFLESRFQEALAVLLRLNNLTEPPQNIRFLLQMANIYKSLNDNEKLTQVMREAAALVPLRAEILYDIHPWIARCNEPSVILAFVEKLLEIRDVPNETRVSIYEFAAYCYGGPLHLRFEADKYAIAAANLAPNSFKTRLLAARVFDPKEAMSHATAAASLSPFSIEPYQAMLEISKNANRFDLQARVEQQLNALGVPTDDSEALQVAYVQRYPRLPECIDDTILRLAQTVELNPNIQALLKLAGARAQQIFAVPERKTDPITMAPQLANLFFEIAETFGMPSPDAQIIQDAPFVFSVDPNNPSIVVFNVNALSAASEAERRFHMAAAVMHTMLGTLPLVTLPHENIAMMISGILGLYDEKLSSPNVINSVKSFLPRNLRKTIVEFIASQGIASFQYDPIQLQFAASALDTNIGHVFSADLIASIMAIMRRKKPNMHIPNQPQQLMMSYGNMPNIPGLFAFNTSERFSEIRQRLGLFIKMTL